MKTEDLRRRTKQFALRVIRLSEKLPKSRVGDTLARQIVKSGMSVGANYHEAVRASSKRQFISQIEIALRESVETRYWLDLIQKTELIRPELLIALNQECEELSAILTATVRTAKRNLKTADLSSKRPK